MSESGGRGRAHCKMDTVGDGMASIVALSGAVVPARARFIGRTIAETTFASVTLGMVCGQVGALTPLGPLLPFLAGSWTGYTLGCCAVWHRGRRDAVECARRYPKLLAHTLKHEFAIEAGVNAGVLERWICEQPGRLSWAILAAQQCQADVQELQSAERQKVIDEYAN